MNKIINAVTILTFCITVNVHLLYSQSFEPYFVKTGVLDCIGCNYFITQTNDNNIYLISNIYNQKLQKHFAYIETIDSLNIKSIIKNLVISSNNALNCENILSWRDQIIISGTFYNNFSIGENTFTGSSDGNAFLVYLDTNGLIHNYLQINGNCIINGISKDKSNGIYLAGTFKNQIKIGGRDLHSFGESDAFFAKFVNDSLIWINQIGTFYSEYAIDCLIKDDFVYYLTSNMERNSASIDDLKIAQPYCAITKFNLNGEIVNYKEFMDDEAIYQRALDFEINKFGDIFLLRQITNLDLKRYTYCEVLDSNLIHKYVFDSNKLEFKNVEINYLNQPVIISKVIKPRILKRNNLDRERYHILVLNSKGKIRHIPIDKKIYLVNYEMVLFKNKILINAF